MAKRVSARGKNPYNDIILRKNYRPRKDRRTLPVKKLIFENELSAPEKTELLILIWDNKHAVLPKWRLERLHELERREVLWNGG